MGMITEEQLRQELQNRIDEGANARSYLIDGASSSMDTFAEVEQEFNSRGLAYSCGNKFGDTIIFHDDFVGVTLSQNQLVGDSSASAALTLQNLSSIQLSSLPQKFQDAINNHTLEVLYINFNITSVVKNNNNLPSNFSNNFITITPISTSIYTSTGDISINMGVNISSIYESLADYKLNGTFYIEAYIGS